jgi:uncharacterized CHY-type Zn-finger protein
MIRVVEEHWAKLAQEAEEHREIEAERQRAHEEQLRKIEEFKNRLLKCKVCGGRFTVESRHSHWDDFELNNQEQLRKIEEFKGLNMWDVLEGAREELHKVGFKCDRCGRYYLDYTEHQEIWHKAPPTARYPTNYFSG